MVMMTLHGPLRKELRAAGSIESLVTVIFPCRFNPGDLLACFKSTTGWGWEAFSPQGAGKPANYSGESRHQPPFYANTWKLLVWTGRAFECHPFSPLALLLWA